MTVHNVRNNNPVKSEVGRTCVGNHQAGGHLPEIMKRFIYITGKGVLENMYCAPVSIVFKQSVRERP